MHIVHGLGVALIHVVAVPLAVLYACGKREWLQPVFMDSLAPQRPGLSVGSVLIDRAFVVLDIAFRSDVCSHNIGR